MNNYLDINFEVLHAATSNRCADGIDIRLINPVPVALFTNYKLATSSGKYLEAISHAHIVYLLYKLTTGARNADVFFGFDSDHSRRQRELSNNKNQKGKNHIRIFLKMLLDLLNTKKKLHMD